MLVTNRLYGSAFVLIRSVFESYIRGVWLYRCASDTEIEAFKTDKLKKNFEELVQDIENLKDSKSTPCALKAFIDRRL